MKAINRPVRQAPVTAEALLFSAYHLKLLGALLMRPDESFHLRELERMTGVSSGTALRELRRMHAAGIVTAERVGNQLRFRADLACPLFPELQGIVRKTVGLADVLREALAPLVPRIERAFVFGSIASGTAGPRSDIDLMVVGDVDFADVVTAVHGFEQRLGRPVNPVVLDAAAWKKRRKESAFIARVLSGPVVPLIGVAHDA